jgi:hypothetical protein
MKRSALIIALLLIPVYFGTTYAYQLKKWSWNWIESTPKVVHLWINPNCADPSAPNELIAITNAYNTWSAVLTNFDFNYSGSSYHIYCFQNDSNDVCWNPGIYIPDPRSQSVTGTWANGDTVTEADIVFFDSLFVWCTGTPSDTQMDVESAALHELGHVLGLGNYTDPSVVMYDTLYFGEMHRSLATDDINGMKAIYGLVVTNPNGSGTWDVGQLYYIIWDHEGVSGNVSIFLNRNYPDANGWGKIIGNTPNDGIQPWTAKTPPSSNSRIRVESFDNEFVYDASDANFTIAGYTVTYPTESGISWPTETYRTITWSSLGVTGNVNIKLNREYPSETSWEPIWSNTADDGSYRWWVTGEGESTTCRIKIENASDTSNYDISNNNFRIIENK